MSFVAYSFSRPALEGLEDAVNSLTTGQRGRSHQFATKHETHTRPHKVHGADLESASRKYHVTAATVSRWRHAYPTGGAEALTVPQMDLSDEQLPTFDESIACGVRLRHDHGPQLTRDDFQSKIAFPGIELSPAFVRAPKGTAASSASSAPSKSSCSGCETSRRLRNWQRRSKSSASGTTTTGCWRGSCFNPRGTPFRGCSPSRLLHKDNQTLCPRNRMPYNPGRRCAAYQSKEVPC